MAVFVKSGTDEISLETVPGELDPTEQDSAVTELLVNENKDATLLLLNREWFVDASQIRSEYIQVYSGFPAGDAVPARRLKILRQDAFDEAQGNELLYNDHSYGDLSYVYFEPSTKRLRFNAKFGSNVYLSFPAYLMPSKIDLIKFSGCNYADYPIKSPTYAENFIIYTALKSVLPIGSQARQFVTAEAQAEEVKLFAHIPQNTSAIEITNGYIG